MAFRREMIGVALSAALLLVLLPATALAAPQWVGGEVLDAAGGVPDVATDAQGNSAAVWTRAGHVWVAERPHGGPWGAAEDLEPAGGAEAQPPKIVALPDGELVAAWVGGDFGFEVHAARRPAGGGWSASAVINSTCCPNLEDLVVGADGTVMGYWTSDDGPSETAVKPPGSADWDPAQTLAQGGPDTEVAVAPDGSAVAAYPDCAVTCISAVHRPPGGDWGDPEAVSAAVGAVTGIALASRPDNRFTVVWTEGPAPIGVRSADRSPGAAGTWGARQPVADTPAGRAGCPSSFGCVDLASRGDTLAAVWQQGSEIAAALRSGGGGWGAAEHVGDPDEGDATPQAALTADGTAVAAWLAGPGRIGAVVRGAHRQSGGTWAQEDLGAASSASEASLALGDVAADGLGDAVAGWRDPAGAQAAGFDGTGPRFDLFSAPTPTTQFATQPFAARVADNWSGLQSLSWAFGDGGTAEGALVDYAYPNPGEFTATATARDSLGNASQRSGAVSVAARPTQPCESMGSGDKDGDKVVDGCDTNDGSKRPVPFKTVNATVVSGVVFVKLPAGSASAAQAKPPKGFVRLIGAETIPVGSILDTAEGRVRLRTAADTRRHTQRGQFFDGRFRIRQVRKPRGRAQRRSTRLITELRLTGSSFSRRCGSGRASVSQRRKRRVRRLWGDGRGRFRTRGRNAAATVKGTRWLVEDRCDGTLVRVRRGRVSVRDLARGTTVTVRAGRSYLARRR